jgi:hypothetical protein
MEPACRIDEAEGPAPPRGLDLDAVARHAGVAMRDRLAASEEAVHERGLAHVLTADDGDPR